MSEQQFSDGQIQQWADEVSDQLNTLTTERAERAEWIDSRLPLPDRPPVPLIPAPQRAIIEAATGEPAEAFWEKYKRHARLDLCQPDGNLYKIWHQWQDLPSKDVVKMSGSALAGMGFGLNVMSTVGVAASVVLLYILLNVGIEAICEDCPPAGAAPAGKP